MRAVLLICVLLSGCSVPGVRGDGATDALSCKMDELGVRANMVLADLTNVLDTANAAVSGIETSIAQGQETLNSTKVAPMGTVPTLGQLFCLDPANVKGLQSASIILPSDWECQGRKEGEPWPCPKGIPSKCRYYDQARTTARRSEATFGGSNFDSASDTVLADMDEVCVRNYCYGPPGAAFDKTSDRNTVGFKDSCCEKFEHTGDDTLRAATYTALGVTADTPLSSFVDCADHPTYTDGAHGDTCAQWVGYDCSAGSSSGLDETQSAELKANCPVACKTTCAGNANVVEACGAVDAAGSYTKWLETEYWGYRYWHEDPNVKKHFVHFAVNRYEMGPTFGVQLYSPQLDTLRVRPNGDVSFKPTTGDYDIDIFEDLQYEPFEDLGDVEVVNCSDIGSAADGSRRRLEGATRRRMDRRFPAKKSEAPVELSDAEMTAERFRGSCRPADGCAEGLRGPEETAATHQEGRRMSELAGRVRKMRRLRRGARSSFSGQSSFLLMGSNRAGND